MARRKPCGGFGRERADAPDWSACACSRGQFVELVWQRGAELYRDLPWRGVSDPYGVLVSEVMLQQTQVARVLKYWERWMGLFPTADALAAADTATVLEAWQGLGYNRRALALKRACEQCARVYGGTFPLEVDALVAFPGIGPATAAGVAAFAGNRPAVYLETNVRSVFLHELFPEGERVADGLLVPYVADTCPSPAGSAGGDRGPRSWYYALLDYGAFLKKQVANPSRRSAHHARQGKFEGSHREKRSFVLRQVLASPEGIDAREAMAALDAFEREAGRDPLGAAAFDALVEELAAEGFFRREGWMLVP